MPAVGTQTGVPYVPRRRRGRGASRAGPAARHPSTVYGGRRKPRYTRPRKAYRAPRTRALRFTPAQRTALGLPRFTQHKPTFAELHTGTGSLDYSGQPSTLTALSIASLGLPIAPEAAVATKLGELGVAALRGTEAARTAGRVAQAVRGARGARAVSEAAGRGAAREARAAEQASEEAAKASRARRVARVARHPVRAGERAAGRGARAGARKVASTRAGRALVRASRSPAGARAGRIAGKSYRVARPVAKTATYPVRHPFKGGALVQAPAVVSSGSTSPLGKTSVVGTALNKVGTTAGGALPGVAGNIVKDAFNLPATALPAVYMPLAGAVHAARTGDTAPLNRLLAQYNKSGLLPAIFHGDPKQALRAIEHHPLYSALEVSGAYAGAGRGLGAIARKGTGGALASEVRAPLQITHDTAQERFYSKNVLTKQGQKAGEAIQRRRGRDPNVATEKQATAYFRGHRLEGHKRSAGGVIHRFIEQHELRRRENRTRVLNERHAARPKRHHGAVAEVVQASIRSPETFHQDIASRIAELERQAKAGTLTKPDLQLNRQIVADLKGALDASPKQIDAIFQAARAYSREHNAVTAEAVSKGLYDAGQVQRARLFPYVQRHMGGGHGIPNYVPRRLAEISAEVKRIRREATTTERSAAGNVRLSRKQENIARGGQEQARVTSAALGRAKLKRAAAGLRIENVSQFRRSSRAQEGYVEESRWRVVDKSGQQIGALRNTKREAQADLERLATRTAAGRRAAGTLEHARGRAKVAGQQVTGDIRDVRKAARAHGHVEAGATKQIRELRKEFRDLKRTPAQLLDRNGDPLTTAQIHAHMRANGLDPEDVGFLSHAPGITGARSFNQRAHSRSQIARQGRTGESFRKGTYDASYDALAGQHAYTQGIVDRAQTWDALIRDHGIRAPNGGYWRNRSDAENVAVATGGHVPLVPLEISPWLSLRKELDAARRSGLESATLNPGLLDRVQQGIDRSLTATHGRFVLAPEELVSQLQDHFRAANAFDRGMSSVTQAFKYAVLPTSDKWIAGNVLDQGLRAAFSGINPIPGLSAYNRVGRKLLNRVEELHGREARASIERQMISGGHYAQRANYRMNEASNGLAAAAHQIAQLPIAKQLTFLYSNYAKAVFAGNGWLERQMELAGLGKVAMEDIRRHNSTWETAIHVQKGALDDLANGLVNTDKQVSFAHQVENIFGRWRGNSPGARRVIQGYAPFYLWARNASRFILLTLPAKHPIKTALIAAAATMTEKDRKKLGLDLFAKRPLPGFLQGGLPGPLSAGPIKAEKGGVLPFQYYSSFGPFANYPGFLGNVAIPYISGATKIAEGLTWSGQQLTNPDGTPVNDPRVLSGLAINSIAEGIIPFLSIARRVREGGGSSAPTSTAFYPQTLPGTKPKGTPSILGGAGRVYLPRGYPKSTVNFLRGLSQQREIHIPAKKSSGSSSGSNWWDTGSSPSTSSSGGEWWK